MVSMQLLWKIHCGGIQYMHGQTIYMCEMFRPTFSSYEKAVVEL